MTMMENLWQSTLCNRDQATKLFNLTGTNDWNGTMARIECKYTTIKYASHFFRGWPGDQSRLQWLVLLDHIRKEHGFAIPNNPVISSDELEEGQKRLLYHAGSELAKLRMGMDYTKLMMQENITKQGDLCDPQWRLQWSENAWKEISLLPGVQFRAKQHYSGSFEDFEKAIRKNRRPIKMFNIMVPRNQRTPI